MKEVEKHQSYNVKENSATAWLISLHTSIEFIFLVNVAKLSTGQAPSWSSTLPRPPGHFMKTELKSETDQGSLSPDQQKDIDELLRSVQNLDFTKTPPKQVG